MSKETTKETYHSVRPEQRGTSVSKGRLKIICRRATPNPFVKPFDCFALRVNGFYLNTVRLVGLELAEGSLSKHALTLRLFPFVLSLSKGALSTNGGYIVSVEI
ncbi:MAG: hypothetical protein COB09_14315 [Thalassobium sp.]|nr:MAG: hypothetical protein COB09_14315 [Thalassobium sp.]